jgi:hypothetical protein
VSLTFGAATSDRVECGTMGAVNATKLSLLDWFYPTTLGNNRSLITKVNAPLGWFFQQRNATDLRFIWLDTSGGNGANYLTNNAALTVNKWWCVAVTMDQAGTGGARAKIYLGDLVTPLTECTYGTATDSGVAYTDPSAQTFRLGNNAGLTVALQGRMAVAAYIENRVLSLGEVQSWQFAPRMMAGCVGLWRLGDNGTGTQPDLSGNGNNGTVTGATQSDNPPLRRWMMPRPRAPYRVPEGFTWANDDGWMTSGMVEPSATALWGG